MVQVDCGRAVSLYELNKDPYKNPYLVPPKDAYGKPVPAPYGPSAPAPYPAPKAVSEPTNR